MKPESVDKKMYSFKRLIKSFSYAITGIKDALKREQNLNIHFLVFVLVILLSIYFKVSHMEILIIILVSGLVISLEMVNTAIENTVDNQNKYSKEAKMAKDCASGAVLVAAITAIIIGIYIFLPRIIALFS